ncbi:MAG: glutamate synthase central domain-containing protein, partial [Snowella sp.]
RLQPGKMFLVDTKQGRIIADDEVKEKIISEHPYGEWLQENLVSLDQLPGDGQTALEPTDLSLLQRQLAFGYTFEELRILLTPMARDGVEATGSMGADTPIAVLSDKPKLLYNYFQQLFAQVTNPPIDSIREEIITSPDTTIGSEGNLLNPTPESCHLIELKTPIITNDELAKLKALEVPLTKGDLGGLEQELSPPAPLGKVGALNSFKSVTLPILFDPKQGSQGLESVIADICSQANQAIAEGVNIIILSDRGVSADKAAIPALLAVSGLHHHLIRVGTRTRVGLVLESGEPREVHHHAVLIGYGCGAINPYMVFETFEGMIADGLLPGVDYYTACKNYIKAATKGVIKVASKIGISTIQSYRGAQIFEAIGLNKSVIDKYFTWTASRIAGSDIDILTKEAVLRHQHAFPDHLGDIQSLDVGGEYQWRKDGEEHLFNPQTIHNLQKAVREGNYAVYKEYAKLVNEQDKKFYTLRGLLDFKQREPIPLEEVEPIEAIMKRFKTGAMSYGSISQEAHESLAIAMNRIGGKSNTGEGGED